VRVTPLHLTDLTWNTHDAELEELETVVAGLCSHLGVYEPFADGLEWSLERAEARLLANGPLPPIVTVISKAMTFVYRSILAAGSERERMLTNLVSLRDFIKEQIGSGDAYHAARREEVEAEHYLDQLIGGETLHCEDREQHVAAKIQAWRDSMNAALQATRDLTHVLDEERPVTVKAGLYSAKGAGSKVEFALRLLQGGLHQDGAALIRNDVKISDRSLKSRTQRAEIRRKGKALRSEVNRALARIESILQEK
jgi:hypothetical protein